jgi:Family of unknown function (DUF5808)
MAPSPRPPPPAWIGLGPPVAAALLLALQRPAWVAWVVLGGALLVVGIIEVVASSTRANGDRRPELKPVVEAGVGLARLVGLAVSSLESMLAVAIGLGQVQAVPLVVAAGLLMVLVAVVTGVRRISAGLEAIRASGHGQQVKGYGAMFYVNKEDPRIWVPKLSSVGQTLNFAHPVSWLILAAILVVPVGCAVVAILSVIARWH